MHNKPSSITDCIRKINQIIERESKSSTYKFALLRAVVELVASQSPLIVQRGNRMDIPMGLVIEKWMYYYYPLLLDIDKTPQNTGSKQLVFYEDMLQLHSFYENNAGDGLTLFYHDLNWRGLPEAVAPAVLKLAKNIRKALVTGPMKHLGQSIGGMHYSIFQVESSSNFRKANSINKQWLINQAGMFSIPIEFYESFALIGNLINGDNSLLMHWANFSRSLDKQNNYQLGAVLSELIRYPISKHDVKDARHIYENLATKHCVWSDQLIRGKYEVDHMFPFAVLKNNDLWNLFPASSTINNSKRDKIPTAAKLKQQKTAIQRYWKLMSRAYPQRFFQELKLSLTGIETSDDWPEIAFGKLLNLSDYLIHTRGCRPW